MKISLLMCICMLICLVPANANLILNGDFEAPLVGAGSLTTFAPGPAGPIPDWAVVGAAGTQVAITSGTYTKECCVFAAQSLNQWLDLTGLASNQFEGVEQTIAAAGTYDLSFWVGNAFDLGGVFGTTSTVQVRVGGIAGTLVGNFTNSSTTPGVLTWELFTTTFTTTGATTLDFLNLDPATDNSNGLDDIILTTAAIPEPGTLSLFGMGIIGLGLIRRLVTR